jgi:hypothetical protein
MTPDIEAKIASDFAAWERNEARGILLSLERELGTLRAYSVVRYFWLRESWPD